jgi:hypothetical protein
VDFRLESYPNFHISIAAIQIFLLNLVQWETNIRVNNITHFLNILIDHS